MSDKLTNTTVEILGKFYSIRCPETELKYLEEAALYLNNKMLEVQESGKAINLERIAIMAAINITYDLLQKDKGKQDFVEGVNKKILQLQEKIDQTVDSVEQVEFAYKSE